MNTRPLALGSVRPGRTRGEGYPVRRLPKTAPGGVAAPSEGLTKGEIPPMAKAQDEKQHGGLRAGEARELQRRVMQAAIQGHSMTLYNASKELKKKHPLIAEALADAASELETTQADWVLPALLEEVEKTSEEELIHSYRFKAKVEGVGLVGELALERQRIEAIMDAHDALSDDEQKTSNLLDGVDGLIVELDHKALVAILERRANPYLVAEAALLRECGC